MFISVRDRLKRITTYLINVKLVSEKLASLYEILELRKSGILSYVSEQSSVTEVKNLNVEYINTETTTETTTENINSGNVADAPVPPPVTQEGMVTPDQFVDKDGLVYEADLFSQPVTEKKRKSPQPPLPELEEFWKKFPYRGNSNKKKTFERLGKLLREAKNPQELFEEIMLGLEKETLVGQTLDEVNRTLPNGQTLSLPAWRTTEVWINKETWLADYAEIAREWNKLLL